MNIPFNMEEKWKKKILTIPKQPGMVIIPTDNSIFTECQDHVVIIKKGNYQSKYVVLTQVICGDFFLSPGGGGILSTENQYSGNVFLECLSAAESCYNFQLKRPKFN